MFNQVFHSAWVAPTSGTDKAFMPRNAMQWLFYPFYWISKNRTQGGNSFADARYAAAMVAMLVMVGSAWAARRWRRPEGAGATRFVLLFVATSYGLWLVLYSILRYAVPVEALSGFVILLAVQRLGDMPRMHAWEPKWIVGSMAIVGVLLLGFSRYTDWGHARYSKVAFDVKPGAVEAGSMVVMLGQPHAYVIPFIGNAQTATFVGVTWLTAQAKSYKLGQLTSERIASHSGPMYAVLRDSSDADLALLKDYLPSAELGDCRDIESAMESTVRGTDLSDGLRICGVIRDLGDAG